MRIISGELGGRRYQGKIPPGVRPTADMVRESIFNKLSHLIDLDGAIVADICAGTGAMGIESISRGAEMCYFVDKSRKSCDYIKATLEHFSVNKDKYKVINKPLEKIAQYWKEDNPELQFDLIITDPPYIQKIINDLLCDIVETKLLAPEGVIVAEYASLGGIILPPELKLIDSRKFGETELSYIALA